MAAPATKSAAVSSARWSRRAASAGTEYRDGVERTSKSWQQAAAAGRQNWIAGVQEAAARGAFEKGVAGAGDAKWRQMALAKGPGRFAEGVTAGQSDYEKGVAPYLEVASRTDLPMRGPTGSDANYQRSTVMARAFRQAKTGRK